MEGEMEGEKKRGKNRERGGRSWKEKRGEKEKRKLKDSKRIKKTTCLICRYNRQVATPKSQCTF